MRQPFDLRHIRRKITRLGQSEQGNSAQAKDTSHRPQHRIVHRPFPERLQLTITHLGTFGQLLVAKT